MANGKQKNEPVTEQAWRLMCDRQTFTSREIAQELSVTTSLIWQLISRLKKQKAVALAAKKFSHRGNLYRVCIDQNLAVLGSGNSKTQKPKCNTLVQQIWNSIRIHKSVDSALLLTTTQASQNLVSKYLRQLSKAGYVKPMNQLKGSPENTRLKYRLSRDTGRLHPITKSNGMWDQNTQTFYPFTPTKKRKGAANE